jgi:hypothetical protein
MDIETLESDDREAELVALARLVAYALESSRSLEAEVVEFCLDKALHAVLEQIGDRSRAALTASDIMIMNRSALC